MLYGIDNTELEARNRANAKNLRREQFIKRQARELAEQRRLKPWLRPSDEKLRTNWQ